MPALIGHGRQIGQLGQLDRERAWPLDARMAMFVLEAGGFQPEVIRSRHNDRMPCRNQATLVAASRAGGLTEATIYIRDYNDGHIGFISELELPMDALVWMHLTTDAGEVIQTPCRIGRSRPFMAGWYEGVLHLSEERAQVAIPA